MTHATWSVVIVEALLCFFILWKVLAARGGKKLFIRRIPGLNAIDEAVGRATEMGRPTMFIPGITGIDIQTLQGLSILKHVTGIAAKYRTRVIVPTADSIVNTVASEVSKEAYTAHGMPELFNQDDMRYLSDDQFAFASGVVGILNREKVAANMMFGFFAAESLILAETGQNVGAIQVAGTAQINQIPFFITTCDYTIIGDEFYAASAYLSREPTLLGSLVGQDFGKAIIIFLILAGTVTATVLAANAGLAHSWLNWIKFFNPG